MKNMRNKRIVLFKQKLKRKSVQKFVEKNQIAFRGNILAGENEEPYQFQENVISSFSCTRIRGVCFNWTLSLVGRLWIFIYHV